MPEIDALERLLAVAELEGALSPGRLADFAAGLRERARLVLQERVGAVEAKLRELESGNAALEKENAWRHETASALEAEAASLKRREAGLRAELDAAREEAARLRAACEQAVAASRESDAVHERLLAHHRRVVDLAIRQFAAASALPFWRVRARRSLLSAAVEQFAQELR